MLERLLLPALGNAVRKFAYGQASVDLARVAIALERYRLAHGEYPESLDALAPQFIDKAAARHHQRPAVALSPHGGWAIRSLFRRLE